MKNLQSSITDGKPRSAESLAPTPLSAEGTQGGGDLEPSGSPRGAARLMEQCPECAGGGTAFYGHPEGEDEECRTCGGWGEVPQAEGSATKEPEQTGK